MKLILLSGGSGKRLWPLSNDTRSKQFLKVLEDVNGERQSMVQRVWKQIEEVDLAKSTIIATSKMQSDMIYNQISSEVPIIIEPERRDTFPAIALSSLYLYNVQKTPRDEVIIVLPVDPYVKNKFFESIKDLESCLKETDADIALLGVKPTYPSSKYGYMVPNKEKYIEKYIYVEKFIEKPNECDAQNLIKNNALWNCGVFAFKLDYLLRFLEKNSLPQSYDQILKHYSLMPKISFDYNVLEKANNIVALQYDGFWKDLGTWNTLTEEMATNQIGIGVISEESKDCHLVNELDIPITVLGLENVIVAASPDGILVAEKALSPKIKDLIMDFDYPPMYEERIWGWSRVLDYTKYPNGKEMVTKRIHIEKGKNSSYHFHKFRDEVWTIVLGEGELALEDRLTRVKAGDIIHLPKGKKHGIRSISDLEFIEVQTGEGISDNDFVRLYHNWNDVIEHYKDALPKVIQ
ncbi:sugar phosphate nucleotidyltransferase [Heyndrickxia coagulans]|uniref:sugar phosphate nucleotidyltransferase n=1 Tax=Heyndrickxia coagulans TaxID=1398 RepID=UPI002E1A4C77|nr:sugar phosphate nucleotidyltransferase [Heyndrickxia coagulans]MED4967015.1 sugar phosphate nucleotidyltransferase [Heyndrickxia coagulans]